MRDIIRLVKVTSSLGTDIHQLISLQLVERERIVNCPSQLIISA